jgi:hypothetical protein
MAQLLLTRVAPATNMDGTMAAIIFEGDGILILGQEQDVMGSGFNEAESFMGYLSSVAMWDYILQVTEVWDLTVLCGVSSKVGNIFMWTDFLDGIHGDLKVWAFIWFLPLTFLYFFTV